MSQIRRQCPQMASMEVVGAQDVELKFVAAGEWLVSSLMNNLNWSKLEKDPRFALSGHGLPLYWLSRGQSSDWFVFWHLLWYLGKLTLKSRWGPLQLCWVPAPRQASYWWDRLCWSCYYWLLIRTVSEQSYKFYNSLRCFFLDFRLKEKPWNFFCYLRSSISSAFRNLSTATSCIECRLPCKYSLS